MALVPKKLPKMAGTGKDIGDAREKALEEERKLARTIEKRRRKGLKVRRVSLSKKRIGSADTEVVSAADDIKRPRMALLMTRGQPRRMLRMALKLTTEHHLF